MMNMKACGEEQHLPTNGEQDEDLPSQMPHQMNATPYFAGSFLPEKAGELVVALCTPC